MLSKLPFLKALPANFKPAAMWPQLILLITGIVGGIFLKAAIVPVIFVLYVLLSLIAKPKEA